MKIMYIIILSVFIGGFNLLCVGQETDSANLILPANLSPIFPLSGYPFSKTIENRKTLYLKKAEEKQLLPINGIIEFFSSRQTHGFYSFLIRKDKKEQYFIDIRHRPNKSGISLIESIAPYYTQEVSIQFVEKLLDVYTLFINNFKSNEVSIVSFDGIKVIFRCIIEEEHWTFSAMNPTGGEFLELTNSCHEIIRDCSKHKFNEKECIKQLEELKNKYLN